MTRKIFCLASLGVLLLAGCGTTDRGPGMREFGYTYDLTAPPYPTREVGAGAPVPTPGPMASEKVAAAR